MRKTNINGNAAQKLCFRDVFPTPFRGAARFLARHFSRTLAVLSLAAVLACVWLNHLLQENPFPVESLRSLSESPVLLDRHGRTLARGMTYGETWRLPVLAEDISPWLLKATVAVEDERFFSHGGVDFTAVCRATLQNLFSLEVVSGASTLDMQLCRMLEPRPRTFSTKLSEAARAWRADERLTKEETLLHYLNLAPYGGNLQGVEAAARRYFGKSSQELSLPEAALLAGLPQAPSRLRPDRFPEAAKQRRDKVLNRMFEAGMISRLRADDAIAAPIDLFLSPLSVREALHFVTEASARRPGGGATFLDLALQRKVESLAKEWGDSLPAGAEVAVVVLELETGGVASLVGGLDFDNPADGQVNGATAWRSPGSTLKPFLFAVAASEGRLDGDTLLSDAPGSFAGWAPQNFDRSFSGEVPAAEALRRSLNLPALRVAREVGVAKAVGVAEACGLRFRRDPAGEGGLAFTLGSAETRLLDLTNAYATLGRNGLRRKPRFFTDEPVVDALVLDADVCAWIGHELSSRRFPSAAFTGASSLTVPWFMRKTGTSSGRRDALAVGHNSKYAVGVWTGRFSGMGDAAFVGARVAEPLLARIFDLPEIRVTQTPPAHEPWKVHRPIPLPQERKDGLAILSPEPGAVFRRLNEDVELWPRANLSGPDLLWFLDGRRLLPRETRRLFVSSGRHELLCVSPGGTHARASFEVR